MCTSMNVSAVFLHWWKGRPRGEQLPVVVSAHELGVNWDRSEKLVMWPWVLKAKQERTRWKWMRTSDRKRERSHMFLHCLLEFVMVPSELSYYNVNKLTGFKVNVSVKWLQCHNLAKMTEISWILISGHFRVSTASLFLSVWLRMQTSACCATVCFFMLPGA